MYNSNIFSKGARDTINTYRRAPQQQNSGRSFLNEVFDLLSIGQYATAGYATESIKANKGGQFDPFAGWKGAAKGVAQGLSILPGWEGFKDPADYSYGKDVLTEMGWEPESRVGKLAKGTVGFAGDVLLDPLTYVSLGGTSLLKGSGKVGKEVTEAAVKQMAEAGLNRAAKEVGESMATGGLRQLSKESAVEIVQKFARDNGIQYVDDQVEKVADDFIKTYNNLLGQNRLGNKGATVGAENIPFANKFFKDPSKYTFEFVSKETMEKLGDKTLAPYIDRITESFYSSPLGKKFSTKTGLRELAKEDPQMLYETLEFMKYVGKNNPVRQEQIQLLKKWVDEKGLTNLTPAKQKQMIKYLQNKEMLKYLDIQTGAVSADARELYEQYVSDIQNAQDLTKNIQQTAKQTVDARDIQVKSARELFKDNRVVDVRSMTDEDVIDLANIQTNLDVGLEEARNAGLFEELADDATPEVVQATKKAKVEVLDQMKELVNRALPGEHNLWDVDNSSKFTNLRDDQVNYLLDAYEKGGADQLINAIKGREDIRLKLTKLYEYANKYAAQNAGKGYTKVSRIRESRVRNVIKQLTSPDFVKGTRDGEAFEALNMPELAQKLEDMLNVAKTNNDGSLTGESWNKIVDELSAALPEDEATRIIDEMAEPLYDRAEIRNRFIKESKEAFSDYDPVRRAELEDEIATHLMDESKLNTRMSAENAALEKNSNRAQRTINDLNKSMDVVDDKRFVQKEYAGGRRHYLQDELDNVEKKIRELQHQEQILKGMDIPEDVASEIFKRQERPDLDLYYDRLFDVDVPAQADVPFSDSAPDFLNDRMEELVKQRDELAGKIDGNATKKQQFDEVMSEIQELQQQLDEFKAGNEFGDSAPDFITKQLDDLRKRKDELLNTIGEGKTKDPLKQDSVVEMNIKSDKHRQTVEAEVEKMMKATEAIRNADDITEDMVTDLVEASKKIEEAEIDDIMSFDEFRELRLQRQVEGLDADDIKLADEIRENFKRMGQSEVFAGLLEEEQLAKYLNNYFPGIMTKAGKKAAAEEELVKGFKGFMEELFSTEKSASQKITDLFGLKQSGKESFAKNKFYEDIIGKNEEAGFEFFMEDIANVYIHRAMAHNDAFYQRGFAQKFVQDLGTDAFRNGAYQTPAKGFRTAVAYGDLMDEVNRVARATTEAQLKARKLSPEEFRNYYNGVLRNVKEQLGKEIGFDFNDASSWGKPIVELNEEQAMKLGRDFGINPNIKHMHGSQIDLLNHARNIEMAKKSNDLLNVYDKFLQLWKLNVTAIVPGFHGRNAFSNQFQNMLNIGGDILDPQLQVGATKAMKEYTRGGKYTEVLFDDMTWGDLIEEAERVGILGDGYFASDFDEARGMFASLDELAQGNLDEAVTGAENLFKDANMKNPFRKDWIGYEMGRELGTFIEDRDRLLHYASLRRAGESAEAAKAGVDKFLFDYSDLTVFEHTVMKRLFPFYTWMRKNTQLQMEQAILQPELYRNLNKVLNAIDGGESEEQNVPAWAEGYIQLPFDIAGKDAYINPNLPIQDLNNLPRNMDPVKYIGDLLSRTTPAIKAPVELGLDKNLYFDAPIENEFDYLMNYFSAYNFATQQANPNRDKVDKQLNLLNKGTGIGIKRF